MAQNLDFLAAGVTDAAEPIKRDVTRSRKPNPFEAHVLASWDAREYDDARDIEVGSTKQIETSSAEQTATVVRLVRLAGKNLRIGTRVNAPHDKYEEGGKNKIAWKAGIVKFSTKTLTERSDNGDAATDAAEQDETEEEFADA
jgi:hypothetical protein